MSYAIDLCEFPHVNPRKQPFQADCIVSADRVVRVNVHYVKYNLNLTNLTSERELYNCTIFEQDRRKN